MQIALAAAGIVVLAAAILAAALCWRAYRHSEKSRRALAAELEALAQGADRAASRHVDRLQALGNALAGIAHDINSTLSVLVMNLDMMQQDRAFGEKHAHRLDNMMKATLKGTRLTRLLLKLSHRQEPQIDVVCLAELLPSLTEFLQSAFGKNFEVETVIADELWNTEIDVAGFEAAVLHLAFAAAGSARSTGRITLELKNIVLDAAEAALASRMEHGEHVLLAVGCDGAEDAPEASRSAPADLFGPNPGLRAAERFAAACGGHVRVERDAMHLGLYLPRCRETTAV